MTHLRPFTPRLHTAPRCRRRMIAAPVPVPVPVPAPAPAPVPALRPAAGGDAQYLRLWIVHQAVLYNDLLETIASAPRRSPSGQPPRS
jgi:hypothetical protein